MEQLCIRFRGKFSFALLDRLVEELLVRFDPDEAEARRAAAAEKRHFDVHTGQVGFEGTVQVEGTLDLADALDLDAAVARGAAHLSDLRCGESIDVRRSIAAGDLARAQLALDLDSGESTAAGRRGVTVFVHVSDPVIARYGRHLISVEQVVAWCQAVGTKVTVTPVRDLNHGIRVDQYEVPDRIVEHVELRDGTCRFPLCTRPAERCDKDHVVPWRDDGAGGETDSDNIAPLCRTHHRTKTHSSWHYRVVAPGAYLWTSPRRLRFRVDHTGTASLDAHEP